MPSRIRKKRSKQRAEYLHETRGRYQANSEKKASVRHKADSEKKKASVHDSWQRYQEDREENRAAKRQRYQEDLEENRAAKRQSTRTIQLHLKGVGIGMTQMLTHMFWWVPYLAGGLFLLVATPFLLASLYLVHIHRKFSHIPSPKMDSFFLGHVANVLAMRREMKNEHEPIATIVSKWAADVGNLFVVFFSYHPLVMSTNLEDVKKVAFDQSVAKSHLSCEGLASIFGQRFMGRGLLTAPDYETWKPRRKLYDPSFKRSSLKELLPKFNECADTFLERLRPYAGGKSEAPMKETFHEVTLDVISKVAFSSDFDKEWDSGRLGLKYTTDAKLSHLTLISLKGTMRSFSFPIKRLFTLVHPQEAEMYHEAILAMRRIGRDCIEKRIKAVTSGEEVPNDILTQILQSSVGVKSVDMETLVDDFVTFFVAVILIHQHPEVLDHLLSEVEGVLGDRKEVTGDDLDKMKYTEQVIQEVLRLYPIGLPSLSKDSPKGGIVMSGYHIPEGTTIQFWTSVMCRNPEYFDNPDAFDPSRFDADKPKPGPFVYFPFSVGHRSCIGRHIAMFLTEVNLTKLVFNPQLTEPTQLSAGLILGQYQFAILHFWPPLFEVVTVSAFAINFCTAICMQYIFLIFSFALATIHHLVHPQEAEMYHEAILAMRRIGRDCIEKRIKAVDYLLSEVEGVLGDRNEVTGDDLDKMKYTEQVIQEVLRLYPIALPSLAKDSPKGGIVMSGYHIPEGTMIQFWTTAMCRNPEYFDNPDAFDPSRFDADKPKPGPFVYFPFSVGHRSCIGRHFAMIEAKVILARLLQTFKLTLTVALEVASKHCTLVGFAHYTSATKGGLRVRT
eukprot:Em0012g987a